MSPKKKRSRGKKKKKISSKRKVVGKKRKAKEEGVREKVMLGSLPSVSAAVPRVTSLIPSVAKVTPPLSSITKFTLPRCWGKMPSKKWGKSKIPVTRRRKVKPKDIGLFKFLGKVITAPYQSVEMVKAITEAVRAQAEEERDPKVVLELELLELKMRYERGEITEEDFKIKETKLKRQIKDIQEKRKKEEKAKEVKEKPKRKKAKRKK